MPGEKARVDLAKGLLKVGEDGAVTLGHDGEGEGAVVVLHDADVVVALGQGGLRLDVEAVGVACTTPLTPVCDFSGQDEVPQARVCTGVRQVCPSRSRQRRYCPGTPC